MPSLKKLFRPYKNDRAPAAPAAVPDAQDQLGNAAIAASMSAPAADDGGSLLNDAPVAPARPSTPAPGGPAPAAAPAAAWQGAAPSGSAAPAVRMGEAGAKKPQGVWRPSGAVADPKRKVHERSGDYKRRKLGETDGSGTKQADRWKKRPHQAARAGRSETFSRLAGYSGEESRYFLPNPELAKQGLAERTKYMNDEERDAHELKGTEDGRVRGADGNLLDTSGAGTGQRMDATAGSHIFALEYDEERGRRLYSADAEGETLASFGQAAARIAGGAEEAEVDHTHHSSFTQGGKLHGAGEITAKEGWVKEISNQSGHYRPGAESTIQTLHALDAMGVNTDATKARHIGADGKQGGLYNARAYAASGANTGLLDAQQGMFGELRAKAREKLPADLRADLEAEDAEKAAAAKAAEEKAAAEKAAAIPAAPPAAQAPATKAPVEQAYTELQAPAPPAVEQQYTELQAAPPAVEQQYTELQAPAPAPAVEQQYTELRAPAPAVQQQYTELQAPAPAVEQQYSELQAPPAQAYRELTPAGMLPLDEDEPLRLDEDEQEEISEEQAAEEQPPIEEIDEPITPYADKDRWKDETDAHELEADDDWFDDGLAGRWRKFTNLTETKWRRDAPDSKSDRSGRDRKTFHRGGRYGREHHEYFQDSGAGLRERTRFYDDEERAAHTLGAKDGLLTRADGSAMDTTGAEGTGLKGADAGRNIFTVDSDFANGRRVMAADARAETRASQARAQRSKDRGGDRAMEHVHHSTFTNGNEVDAAGDMQVKEGWVQRLSNQSGHYTPDTDSNLQALQALDAMGVNLDATTVESFSKAPGGREDDLQRCEYQARAVLATENDTKTMDAHQSAFAQIRAGVKLDAVGTNGPEGDKRTGRDGQRGSRGIRPPKRR